MKTTLKIFKKALEVKETARNLNYKLEREIRQYTGDDIHSLYQAVEENKAIIKEINENYFDLLDTVNVSFYIGCRKYYRAVVKLGKSYYDKGEKLTKGSGYRSIEEIPEITQKMTDEMISDSYYY